MFEVCCYTDGSCFPNPGGPGGYAAVVIVTRPGVDVDNYILESIKTSVAFKATGFTYKEEDGKGLKWKALILRGGFPPAEENTNNRMEIQAILEVFRNLKPCTLTIVTDSQYAIGLLSGRNKVHKNLDLKLQFESLSVGFTVKWAHIRGHQGFNLNTIADLLAGEEANAYRDVIQ